MAGGAMPLALSGGFVDPTSSTNELLLDVTDYFDSTGDAEFAFQQWLTTSDYQIFNPKFNQANMVKLVSFDLYALPDFDLDTAASPVMVLFGVPVQVSGTSSCAAQQTTLLTPTSVSNWVKVGSWSAKSLFADANVAPPDSEGDRICGGSFVVVNPDDMEPSALRIQYRAEARFAITMPQVIRWPISVPSLNTPAWDGVEDVDPAEAPVVAQFVGMQNHI